MIRPSPRRAGIDAQLPNFFKPGTDGVAHDILGVMLLACLVAVTTACVLRLHSGGSS